MCKFSSLEEGKLRNYFQVNHAQLLLLVENVKKMIMMCCDDLKLQIILFYIYLLNEKY